MNGQTWHEYGKHIQMYNQYNKNLQTNFEIVFGRQWYLVLFSPLISSAPLGDGMSFDMNMSDTGDIRKIGTKRT
jgi:hypothetical protein